MARELLILCFGRTGCGGCRFGTTDVDDLLAWGRGTDDIVCDLDRDMVAMAAVKRSLENGKPRPKCERGVKRGNILLTAWYDDAQFFRNR